MAVKNTRKAALPPLPKPLREPDYVSKRGINYWWSPEWCRQISEDSYGRIRPILDRTGSTVYLYMQSQKGSLTYIQGSIQQAFKKWHEDRRIDYLLFGEDPKDFDELIVEEAKT